jgi:hypothetical protein
MHAIWRKLGGGDRRSIGRVAEVVAQVQAEPALFDIVFEGMWAHDALVRMRCADAVEKITRERPDLLPPCKATLLRRAAGVEQQEVRWHLAQIITRVRLTPRERRRAVLILDGYLSDTSRIVRTFAMQALAEIAEQDAQLRPAILRTLTRLARTGTPAMQSRGRKLLARLRRAE